MRSIMIHEEFDLITQITVHAIHGDLYYDQKAQLVLVSENIP